MTNVRRKACHQCRTAKARCSLAAPCARCAERRLPCQYPAVHRRTRNNPVNILPFGGGNSTSAESDIITPPAVSFPKFPSAQGTAFAVQNDAAFGWSEASAPELTTAEPNNHAPTPNPNILDTLPLFQWQTTQPELLPSPELGLGSDPPAPTGRNAFDYEDLSLEEPVSLVGPQKTPPRPTNQPSMARLLTKRILLGKLTSYPQRMIGGLPLPPFIHPQCVLQGMSQDECMLTGTHTCLPEPLATCSSIVQMFLTKTSASNTFIWRTIHAEHCRNFNEHWNYDANNLLAALQASAIYTLLQALDVCEMDADIPCFLGNCIQMSRTLYSIVDYKSTPSTHSHDQNALWSTWVLRESTRRTFCLLYGIELVFERSGVFSTHPRNPCGFGTCPLPCQRDLWDPYVTNSEWIRRYKRFVAANTSSTNHNTSSGVHLLEIKDLVFSVQQSPDVEFLSSFHPASTTGAVARWCDELDEFGILVWMAAMLELGV